MNWHGSGFVQIINYASSVGEGALETFVIITENNLDILTESGLELETEAGY